MTPFPAEREKDHALRLLILGGTTEASVLARALAARIDVDPLLSLAGRTDAPATPPIPHRIGGFGGADGLAAFLREQAIDAVVDATHPFAARISANAVAACRTDGVPLAVFTRPAWTRVPGDTWISMPNLSSAVEVLKSQPTRRVFLTTGRLDLARFRDAPQHQYLVRSIDPPAAVDMPPEATVILARPPFSIADEIALMRSSNVDLLVSKNSGGQASAAKLAAARELAVPVLMVERPAPSGAPELHDLDAVLAWIAAVGEAPRYPRP